MPRGKKEYVFGVNNFFVVAPSRHGAHNWEGIGQLSALRSVFAVASVMVQVAAWACQTIADDCNVPLLDPKNMIVAGHSMGAHGAWIVATSSPQHVSCVSAAAGWIRKEDYSNGNDFFSLDISKPYVNLDLKHILERPLSEHHADTLVSNLKRVWRVHVRVGERDTTTHPWYSRRMHRLLIERGVNSFYEEVAKKEHWWWDTNVSNDGGVLNDKIMREFYKQCYNRINRPSSVQQVTANGYSSMSAIIAQTASCEITVANPSTHFGNCGLRIIQQHKFLSIAALTVHCSGSTMNQCEIRSKGNTRRMQFITAEFLDALGVSYAPYIRVDGTYVQLSSTDGVDICWEGPQAIPHACSQVLHPLLDRTLATSGPLRSIYARPLIIVYGTLNSSDNLREAIYDLSVYIANAAALAHETTVSVVADVNYVLHSSRQLHNVMFIGGAGQNSALDGLCTGTEIENASQTDIYRSFCHGRLTVNFPGVGFSVGDSVYENPNQAVISTLPLIGDNLGVLVHANCAEGYVHMSKLAWPVVPPMVRAPFANYVPEVMVVDSSALWASGFGAVLIAGYWDNRWTLDPLNSYISY